MTAVIFRAMAREQGLRLYFTGRPCPQGHIAERRTNNGSCVLCARARTNRWWAKHRKHDHAEKARKKQYDRQRYIENAAAIRLRTALYHALNRSKILAKRNAARDLVAHAEMERRRNQQQRLRSRLWSVFNDEPPAVTGEPSA